MHEVHVDAPLRAVTDERPDDLAQTADGQGGLGEPLIAQLAQHDLEHRLLVPDWDQRLGEQRRVRPKSHALAAGQDDCLG